MMIGVKGKQLCAGNPNAAGQTDMVIPVYPPNFVAGGIINIRSIYILTFHRLDICENLKYWSTDRLVLNAVSATLAILRRPILVAFYDTHGDTEDTFST